MAFYFRTALAGALVSTVSAGLASAAELSGRVTDVSGTASFEGALIRIESLDRETVTGRDGRYRLTGLPEGDYEVSVEYLGADPVTRSVRLTDAQSAQLAFKLGEDVSVLSNVLVVGQAAGQAAALNRQRNASNVISVLSADAIGDFPDQNAAEALRRVPGLSVANDQGEGRFAIIRGIDPALNSTTINGVRVPGPEDGSRQVNLDVVSSDLLESIEVTKAVTPDMDADAIGGNIELKTATAFDLGNRVTLDVGGSYNRLFDETSPKVAASFARVMSLGEGYENFGVSGSVSYFDREFGSDNVETAGFPGIGDGAGGEVLGLEEAEQRDYRIKRERLSAALNFDFRPGANHELFWRNLFSDFGDDEVQLSNVFAFEAGDVVSATPSAANFTGGEVEKLTEAREEVQQIFTSSLGGKSRFGLYTLDYVGAYAFSNEDEGGAVNAAWVGEDLDLAYDLSDRRRPRLIGAGPAFLDPASFALDELSTEDNFTEGTETSLQLDLTRDILFRGHPGFWKIGAKARLRDKESDADVVVFDDLGGDFTLADFALDDIEYPLGSFGPIASLDAVNDFIGANRANFTVDDDESAIESRGADYEVDEDIYAAYAMASLDIGALRVLGGLRVEQTRFDSRGTRVTIDEEGGAGDAVFSPVDTDKKYTDVFPGLHLRYVMDDGVILRAAYTETLGRPSFESTAPIEAIEIEEDDGEFERNAELGNPDLEPLHSRNIDLGIEYYPGGVNVISANLFYKAITDFVVATDIAGQPGRFAGFDEALTFMNGDDADLYGLELNYVQKFVMLPAPWDGLLVNANVTFSESEATLPFRDGEVPLPRQSEVIGNLALGYERAGWNLYLSGAYRNDYFDEINELDDPAFDRYVASHFQVDFRGSYRFSEHYELFFNAVNLNDEPFFAYFQDAQFASQYEEYGRTLEAGFKLTY